MGFDAVFTSGKGHAKESRQSSEFFEQHKHSVVTIREDWLGLFTTSRGSGFFVDADQESKSCLIATDLHVINHKWTLDKVLTHDSSTYTGKVVKRDPSNDLAIVEISGIDDPKAQCKVLDLEKASHALKNDERSFLLTSPIMSFSEEFDSGSSQGVRRSRMLSPERAIATSPSYKTLDYTRIQGNVHPLENWNRLYLEVKLRNQHGDSGSPVVNSSEKCVGILSRGDGVNAYLTPSNQIIKLLEKVKAERESRLAHEH